MDYTLATKCVARGLPMGILPWKLGCPLLPYMGTVGSSVGSSVGSPLLPNIKTWAAQWAADWAAQGNFAMQIRLPTTSIYGSNGQPTTSKYVKSGQLSGQLGWIAHGNFAMQIRLPTTFKYGNSGQFSGQPIELPTLKNGSHLWFTCKTFVAHMYIYIYIACYS